MVELAKGIHRTVGKDGEPGSAWVSDGASGARVAEDEYRSRGYLPEFDSLPVLVIQRVAISITDGQLRELMGEPPLSS